MPIDDLDGTADEYPDFNSIRDFDERLDARQRLLLREMYKGLLDNLNGLRGFLHPMQMIYSLSDIIRHPLTATQRVLAFAWANKIRTLTGFGLNILEGRMVGWVAGEVTSIIESSELFLGNGTTTAAGGELPAFFLEAEQLTSTIASGAGHACSNGVCALPTASSSSISFVPPPIIHGRQRNLESQEPLSATNLQNMPWYKRMFRWY